MYIVRETFLLVSRFLLPQFVYRPIKKKEKTFVHARFTPRRKWILNIELFGKLDIEIQGKIGK